MDQLIEARIEKLREARVGLMEALEGYINSGSMSVETAIQTFMKATLFTRKQAKSYLQLMSGDGSVFRAPSYEPKHVTKLFERPALYILPKGGVQ